MGRLLKRIGLLIIAFNVAGSTPMVLNIPGDPVCNVINLPPGQSYWMAFAPMTTDESTSTAKCPVCPVCPIAGPDLSTGPWIHKARTGPDCFSLDYINSNGTVPKSPLDYKKCPK